MPKVKGIHGLLRINAKKYQRNAHAKSEKLTPKVKGIHGPLRIKAQKIKGMHGFRVHAKSEGNAWSIKN